jgi:hypothetical protein
MLEGRSADAARVFDDAAQLHETNNETAFDPSP